MAKLTELLNLFSELSGDTKMIIGVIIFSGLLVKLSPERSE